MANRATVLDVGGVGEGQIESGGGPVKTMKQISYARLPIRTPSMQRWCVPQTTQNGAKEVHPRGTLFRSRS